MSAIITCTTKLKNKNDLVEALKLMGVPKEHMQVAGYGETVKHNGYGNQKRQVEVNISKKWHSGYGDIGFEKTEDGTYQLHQDDLDARKLEGKSGGEFMVRVQQFYTASVSARTLKENGFVPEIKTEEDRVLVRAVAY
jgi:hypothetical protein